MADAVSRERDELSQRLAGVSQERDRLLAEADLIRKSFEEAKQRAEGAVAEVSRLAHQLASNQSANSLEVLWGVVCKETEAGVAFLRSKIPAGHPGLKWFDLAIETTKKAGCLAIQLGSALVKWATPHVRTLYAQLMREVEQRLAKK